MINYIQRNTYTNNRSGDTNSTQEFCYRRHFRVIPLETKTDKKVFYNKELDMYFESPESYHSYEIEVEDVQVEIAKKFRKAQDFHRRLNYKYDWIRCEKSSNGKITQVYNLDELRANWIKLKARILKDYKGETVELYLDKISKDFENDRHFNALFSQYYEYGLLYPPIPEKHGNEWETQRLIKLDNTPQSELIETIRFEKQLDHIRRYTLTWEKSDTNSAIHLVESEGTIDYCSISNTVEKAMVTLTFMYDDTVINKWEFKLNKIKTS